MVKPWERSRLRALASRSPLASCSCRMMFHHLPAQEVAVHQGLEVEKNRNRFFPIFKVPPEKVARITQGFFQVFQVLIQVIRELFVFKMNHVTFIYRKRLAKPGPAEPRPAGSTKRAAKQDFSPRPRLVSLRARARWRYL